MRNIRRLALSGILAALLFVLSACQVEGVDLNKVLLPEPAVTSSEGAMTLNMEVVDNPAAAAQAGQPNFAALGKITVKFTGIKNQDKEHTSADGVLSYSKGDIPFKLYTDKDNLVFKVDGASQPVVFASASLSNLNGSSLTANPLSNPMLLGKAGNMSAADQQALAKQILPFVLKHFPNPSKLGVEPVNEKINNEDVAMKKIHAEIKGSEAPALLKQFLKNVVADEKGLTELVKVVMKASQGEGSSTGLDYSSLVVGFVQQSVDKMGASLDQSIGTGFFTDESWLKADLYLDGSQQLRKIGFDLNLADPEKGKSPISVVKISGSYEMWNMGKPVTAAKIDTAGAFDATQPAAMAHFAKSLDTNSKLYGLLVKDLQVTRKNIVMTVLDSEPSEFSPSPYIRNGITLVPVRFVTEQLDADVQWNGDTREVTVKDIWSGQKLVFTVDSKKVTVDGVPQTLEVDVELNNSVTYVPLRFISEKFGAKVDFNDGVITIDRP